ncbi:unnamed protein product [Urochloa humidicola]
MSADRRRLLPVRVDDEEGHREGCALEVAAGVDNEQPPSEGMATAAAPGADNKAPAMLLVGSMEMLAIIVVQRM